MALVGVARRFLRERKIRALQRWSRIRRIAFLYPLDFFLSNLSFSLTLSMYDFKTVTLLACLFFFPSFTLFAVGNRVKARAWQKNIINGPHCGRTVAQSSAERIINLCKPALLAHFPLRERTNVCICVYYYIRVLCARDATLHTHTHTRSSLRILYSTIAFGSMNIIHLNGV